MVKKKISLFFFFNFMFFQDLNMFKEFDIDTIRETSLNEFVKNENLFEQFEELENFLYYFFFFFKKNILTFII